MQSGSPTFDKLSLTNIHHVRNCRFAVVVSDWNSDVTYAMRDDAIQTFIDCGVDKSRIDVVYVPGAVELVFASSKLMRMYTIFPLKRRYSGIIVIGCVIKGDTPHFDYVCSNVSQGVALLNSKGKIPIIFSVLTTLNKQQAINRVNGNCGKKGVEAVIDVLRMSRF